MEPTALAKEIYSAFRNALLGIDADIRREAPQVRVRSFLLQQQDIDDWLHRGLADVAIAPAEIPGDLERTPIKTQTYCVVMAKRPRSGLHQPAVVAQHYASTLSLIVQSPDLIAVAPRSRAEGWAHSWPIVVMP